MAVINDRESLDLLVGELEHEDIGQRWYAAMSLAKLGPAILDPLLDLVENGSISKAPAMWAIAEIGDNKAVPVLVNELVTGTDDFHRAMAACALMKIADPEGVSQVNLALADGNEVFSDLFQEVYNR
jgi:HEAT repeat protein